MRKTKRIIALLLVMLLAFSSMALTGCGKKQDNVPSDAAATSAPADGEEAAATSAPDKSAEPITLTVYSQLANYSGMQIGWFAQVMLEKFNVKINIVNDADGVFVTRMESGNLGDIVIFGNDSEDYLEAIDKGMLFDWNEENLLTEYGPYINDNMQKALDKNKGISPDGKLYGFGHGVATSAQDHELYFYHPDIRWDLYKQLGYPKVTTLEDYIDILAQMKELCPTSDSGNETFGVSLFNDWDGDVVMFVKATGALYGYDEMGVGLYDVNNQKWEGSLQDGGMYLRCLAFYNQLYQKGLVDPDSMTQGYDGASEDYIDGVSFFSIFNYLASLQYNTQTHSDAGKAMLALSPDDANTISYGLNIYGSNRVWTIGGQTQYPELCMQIINWLCTPEGRLTSDYGPKGIVWDYDADGKTFLTDLGLATRADGETEMTGGYGGIFKDGTNQMANSTWSVDASNPDSNGESYNYQNWPSYNATVNSTIMNDWRTFSGFTTQDQYLDARKHVVAIGTKYSASAKSDELAIVWEQVIACIKDYSWRAIYAENDDEFATIVAEMQKKAADYGYADCEAWCNSEAALRKAAEDLVNQ